MIELPVSAAILDAYVALPTAVNGQPLHKDPFDRLLIATARAEGLTLLSGDAQMNLYPGLQVIGP